MIYLDSSALVKLIIKEAETAALRSWLAARTELPRISSDLVLVEVPRAIMRSTPTALLAAHHLVARVQKVTLTPSLLTAAAALQPPALRSLDAVHLASALAVRADLTAFVAYDDRLHDAALSAGLPTEQPA
ncbi:MAG TPA: type II toxin-antitoxin system VapC family toxin [Kribbellaceae bacterium]|nr:type II toxin-antitoxin system VapC family toxin [Kribbellaceae bacterium]